MVLWGCDSGMPGGPQPPAYGYMQQVVALSLFLNYLETNAFSGGC